MPYALDIDVGYLIFEIVLGLRNPTTATSSTRSVALNLL